jgi:hypothetical protein
MEVTSTTPSFINVIVAFLKEWGALIFSAASIIIAVLSLRQAHKANKLQNKVNEMELRLKRYELEKVEKEKEASSKALVQARVIKLGNNKNRLKVWNSGGKTAYNVTAQIEGVSDLELLNNDKMPFEELEPMKSFEVPIIWFSPTSKAKILTEWTDESGKKDSKSQMVDL